MSTNGSRKGRQPGWWIALLIAVALFFVVPVLGYGVTKAFVSDGIEGFAADSTRRAVASEAVSTARLACLNKPGVTLLIPEIRVTSVARTELPCADAPGIRPGADHYIANLRAYTLFAVPLRTFRASCNGGFVVCS